MATNIWNIKTYSSTYLLAAIITQGCVHMCVCVCLKNKILHNNQINAAVIVSHESHTKLLCSHTHQAFFISRISTITGSANKGPFTLW